MRVIGLARFPPQVKISFWGAQNLYQVRSLPHRCVCQFIRISESSEENDLIGRAPRRDAHYDRHPHFDSIRVYSALCSVLFSSIQLYSALLGFIRLYSIQFSSIRLYVRLYLTVFDSISL